MKSKATTVKDYLASLPEDRRKGIEVLRKVIRKNLDKNYEESMLWGMIGYAVPHRVWPLGYHCDPSKPLMMAALASQKSNMTVYLYERLRRQGGARVVPEGVGEDGKETEHGRMLRPLHEGGGCRAGCDRRSDPPHACHVLRRKLCENSGEHGSRARREEAQARSDGEKSCKDFCKESFQKSYKESCEESNQTRHAKGLKYSELFLKLVIIFLLATSVELIS